MSEHISDEDMSKTLHIYNEAKKTFLQAVDEGKDPYQTVTDKYNISRNEVKVLFMTKTFGINTTKRRR